jgi:BirA family biotin operon repressor/biotin-[acetyl-CoA-carboxylase] ligase
MSIDAERLRALCQGQGFWQELQVLETATSTNDRLKELACSGAPEGTALIAEEQCSGRGRFGRSWHSPRGGAWFSVLLRPRIELAQSGCIAITLAVGLAGGLRQAYRLPVGVKWPNDLWLNQQKLGGILIELASRGDKIEWMIAGIGINVNNPVPRETRVPATSLAAELGSTIPLELFYEMVFVKLAEYYRAFLRDGFSPIRADWQEWSVLGDRVGVHLGQRIWKASVVGLSDTGKLIVRATDGLRELAAEEVSISV